MEINGNGMLFNGAGFDLPPFPTTIGGMRWTLESTVFLVKFQPKEPVQRPVGFLLVQK